MYDEYAFEYLLRRAVEIDGILLFLCMLKESALPCDPTLPSVMGSRLNMES